VVKWHVTFKWDGDGYYATPVASVRMHCVTPACRGQHNFRFPIYGEIRKTHTHDRAGETACFVCGTLRTVPEDLFPEIYRRLDEWAWPQVKQIYLEKEESDLRDSLRKELEKWGGWNESPVQNRMRHSIMGNAIRADTDLARIYREECGESIPAFLGFFEADARGMEAAQWKRVMDKLVPYIPPVTETWRAHWLIDPAWTALLKGGSSKTESEAVGNFAERWNASSHRKHLFWRDGEMTQEKAIHWLQYDLRIAGSWHEALYLLNELTLVWSLVWTDKAGLKQARVLVSSMKADTVVYRLLSPRS